MHNVDPAHGLDQGVDLSCIRLVTVIFLERFEVEMVVRHSRLEQIDQAQEHEIEPGTPCHSEQLLHLFAQLESRDILHVNQLVFAADNDRESEIFNFETACHAHAAELTSVLCPEEPVVFFVYVPIFAAVEHLSYL